MNTINLLGTSLRLLQRIEDLVLRSIVDDRSRLLIQVLINQLRSEIKIRTQIFENQVNSMQTSLYRLAENDNIPSERIKIKSNRTASRCSLIDWNQNVPNSNNSPVADEKSSSITIQTNETTTPITNRRKLVAVNRLNKSMKSSANRAIAAQNHIEIIKNALYHVTTKQMAWLVEKMAALNISDV